MNMDDCAGLGLQGFGFLPGISGGKPGRPMVLGAQGRSEGPRSHPSAQSTMALPNGQGQLSAV